MVKCESCNKEITHNKGKYVFKQDKLILKVNVCSENCANKLFSKLY